MNTTLLFLVGSLISAFSIWTSVFRYLRIYLRRPPAKWRQLMRFAADSSAPVPKEILTPPVRRQLILGGQEPMRYSNAVASVAACELRPQNRVIHGFFHPNAAAAGGGERVLWAAIKQTLQNKDAVAALYIAQSGVPFSSILETAISRFNIPFAADEIERIVPIFLTQGHLVEAQIYPYFTLVGQMIGTCVLAYEAVSNLVPDVWIDTQGLAFSYPLVWQLAHIPIVAYVHYPWVQSAMLQSIKWYSPKQLYWRALLVLYKFALWFATVTLSNSTWTKQHLAPVKESTIVYPPCSIQSFSEPTSATPRSPTIVYVAQFRPEKRHELLIKAFSSMRQAGRKLLKGNAPHLILIGSVRNKADQDLVRDLDLYAKELGLTDKDYTLLINAPWENVRKILTTSLVGVNAMWNEHFGMGVVEAMAAGLIPVVHASAGPMLDIVKDDAGVPGFLFKSKLDPDYEPGYPLLKEALLKALELTPEEKREMALRVYKAAQRFGDAAFFEAWNKSVVLKTEVLKCQVWRLKRGVFD